MFSTARSYEVARRVLGKSDENGIVSTCLMDVGHVSVEETVKETRPTAKTELKAASTPITASGDRTASRVRANKLHNKNETPVCDCTKV